MKAYTLMTNGDKVQTTPTNGKKFELAQLQAIVGGYIEVIPLNKLQKWMVMHEEGKLEDLPVNEEATKIWLEEYPTSDDYIVGNVLICDGSMMD